ncbi:MAG TPA: four helix bundle protein [Terriglobales bacterium]|nr:four helix bundle protein [Terriglobales bacterium]
MRSLCLSSYKDLIAWQKAMTFVREIYRATANFPREEVFGLTSQLRRAAVSIPSNIAEGKGRYSPRDFQHFLKQARGSVNEVETQLLLARDLDYLQKDQTAVLLKQCEEIGRILNGLISSLRKAEGPTT